MKCVYNQYLQQYTIERLLMDALNMDRYKNDTLDCLYLN